MQYFLSLKAWAIRSPRDNGNSVTEVLAVVVERAHAETQNDAGLGEVDVLHLDRS